ncbi:hypothetical protein CB0940_02102 [Cercospora beticola]|uniref:Rhodopsin domain-containing protein n=1 Tax=Cercospora beticola TaxID=122368 RepID=A0A2G5I8B0_CERBT|nr:hypothetical protein CB0940_02102 [Cercospora beticola]PIB01041.1 hypothetical protein CB0940_02102 [Cercospora beticola]WPA97773.1 hypothetical protein RHO25_002384 [Cercospora beticola]
MSTPSPTPLPDGYKPAAALLDADHRGSWIYITNGFGLVVVLIAFAIRTWIRLKVSPPFRYDDITLAGATVLSIVQAGVVFAQVHSGFGTAIRLLSDAAIDRVQKLGLAAVILYVFTIYASKASVVLLFARISADRFHKAVARGLLASCLVFGIVSAFLVALKCDLSAPWRVYGQQCSSLFARATAVAVFDIVTELILFGISLLLVWNLQTSLKNKSRVVFAFGTRLPLIAVIILRLVYLRDLEDTDDPTLQGTITIVLTQLEIFYGIMAATIPCLRPFLAGFITNYGAMGRETVMGGSHIGGASRKDPGESKGSSFAMSAITSKDRGKRASAMKEKLTKSANRDTIAGSSPIEDESFRPDKGSNDTQVRGGFDARSIASDESTKMIIKKQTQFHVGRERGTAESLNELERESIAIAR